MTTPRSGIRRATITPGAIRPPAEVGDGPDLLRFPGFGKAPMTWFGRWYYDGDQDARRLLVDMDVYVFRRRSSPIGGEPAREAAVFAFAGLFQAVEARDHRTSTRLRRDLRRLRWSIEYFGGHRDLADADEGTVVTAFASLLDAQAAADRRAAKRHQRELRRHGWSCLPLGPRPERGRR